MVMYPLLAYNFAAVSEAFLAGSYLYGRTWKTPFGSADR